MRHQPSLQDRLASGGPAPDVADKIAAIKLRSTSWRRDVLFDLLVAVAVTLPPLGMPDGARSDLSGPATAGVGVGVFVLLLARRRHPLVVLVVALAAATWMMAVADGPTAVIPAVFFILYTVAESTDRTTAVVAGAATAVILFGVSAITSPTSTFNPENVQLLAWAGLAAAAGDAVRSRRAYRAATEERIQRAEQALDEEARRRVVEERLHIARELHDVVAHHIAVMHVQAGVAAHLLRDDPKGAEDALQDVQRGGQSVLTEMGGILSVLRDTDTASGAPIDPLPGFERLEDLFRSFQTAGVAIEWETVGRVPPLPATVSLTAYRIVEESLTNIHKHGGGAGAHVRLAYEPDMLAIEVRNVGGRRPTTPPPVGNGTTGMQQRVTAVGGTLQRGETRSGFRVHARLPLVEGAQ